MVEELIDLLAEPGALTQQAGPLYHRLSSALETAMERGDTATVYRLAHSLKSSSAMVGALRLSNLCKTLEAKVREAREGWVPDGLQEIEAEYARVVGALRTLGAGGES